MERCEPRIEDIVKMQKRSRIWSSGQGFLMGGCEPNIEVIVKMPKRRWVGSGVGREEGDP